MGLRTYYAVVHAELHKTESKKRVKFYEELNEIWTKIRGEDLSTTWILSFGAVSEKMASAIAKEEFMRIVREHKIKMDYILQVSYIKPTRKRHYK